MGFVQFTYGVSLFGFVSRLGRYALQTRQRQGSAAIPVAVPVPARRGQSGPAGTGALPRRAALNGRFPRRTRPAGDKVHPKSRDSSDPTRCARPAPPRLASPRRPAGERRAGARCSAGDRDRGPGPGQGRGGPGSLPGRLSVPLRRRVWEV